MSVKPAISTQALETKLSLDCRAPRVTPTDVDNAIDSAVAVQYHVFPGSQTTVCLLTLRNGYALVGQASCADPANFSPEIGREVSYKDAKQQIWPLLGFELCNELAAQPKEAVQVMQT